VTFIDSSGLRCLIGLAHRINWAGGTIRLSHPDERTRQLLEITELDARFEIRAQCRRVRRQDADLAGAR